MRCTSLTVPAAGRVCLLPCVRCHRCFQQFFLLMNKNSGGLLPYESNPTQQGERYTWNQEMVARRPSELLGVRMSRH